MDDGDTEEVSDNLGTRLQNDLKDGLASLGLELVVEDSIGVIALRVVNDNNVGTAYLEIRDGGLQIRVILANDQNVEIAGARRAGSAA